MRERVNEAQERERERSPFRWRYRTCDGSINYVTNKNGDLKLFHTVLFDQGVLVVGSEHQSQLFYIQLTMDTALRNTHMYKSMCTRKQSSDLTYQVNWGRA